MPKGDGIEKLTSPYTGKVSYRARWSYLADGTRVHRAKTFPTSKQAKDHLTKMRHQLREGVYVEPSQETLGAYMTRWLEQEKHRANRESTYRRKLRAWNGQGKDALGAISLAHLTSSRIQAHYSELAGKGYKPRTIVIFHTMLKMALRDAVGTLIAHDPMLGVKPPKTGRGRPSYWSHAQAQTFLAVVATEDDGAFWILLLTNGVRVGEAIALQWRDVDLERGTITIRRTLAEDAQGRLMPRDGAKTAASHRTVVLLPVAHQALKSQRTAQNIQRLATGPAWQDHDCVFSRSDGRPLSYHAEYDRLHQLADTLGLPRLSPHGLRHTAATNALLAGVHPKIVQEFLGHASIQETLDTYSHVTEGLQRAAAERIDAFLKETGATTEEAI